MSLANASSKSSGSKKGTKRKSDKDKKKPGKGKKKRGCGCKGDDHIFTCKFGDKGFGEREEDEGSDSGYESDEVVEIKHDQPQQPGPQVPLVDLVAQDQIRKLKEQLQAAEAKNKQLKEEKEAMEEKRDQALTCSVCYTVPHGSNIIIFKCTHHLCISCMHEYLCKNLKAADESCVLPPRMAFNANAVKCPECRQDTGISLFSGRGKFSIAPRVMLQAAGLEYKPLTVHEGCQLPQDSTQEDIAYHLLTCIKQRYVPCPFWDAKSKCDKVIKVGGNNTVGDLARALRAHMENDCRRNVRSPFNNTEMEQHVMLDHLRRQRVQFDIKSVLRYTLDEMTADGNLSHLRLSDPVQAIAVQPRGGGTWDERINNLLNRLNPNQINNYFSHRVNRDYFSESVLNAEFSGDTCVVYRRINPQREDNNPGLPPLDEGEDAMQDEQPNNDNGAPLA